MRITSQSLTAQQDRIINRDTTSNGSGNPNFCSNSHLSATELKRMRRYQNNKLFGFHKLQGLANGDDARLEELFNKMQSRGYTAVALAELTKTSTAPSPLASASSPTHIPLPFTHQQIRWQGQCCTYLTNTQQLFSRAWCAAPAIDGSGGAVELRQKWRAISH